MWPRERRHSGLMEWQLERWSLFGFVRTAGESDLFLKSDLLDFKTVRTGCVSPDIPDLSAWVAVVKT